MGRAWQEGGTVLVAVLTSYIQFLVEGKAGGFGACCDLAAQFTVLKLEHLLENQRGAGLQSFSGEQSCHLL